MQLTFPIVIVAASLTAGSSAEAQPAGEPQAPEPGRSEAEAAPASVADEADEAPELGSQPPPDAGIAAVEHSGYDGGFFITSDDERFRLEISGRVQGRYTFESIEAAERDTESAFSIPRARLTLDGHAFTENVRYKFQSDFGKGSVVLKDFYVDVRPGGGPVHVRAGQWKRPFSRQQINSSGRLELVDRAITDDAFGAGRDIGVAVHNNYEKSPDFEWAFGVFNGTGDEATFSGDVLVDPTTGEGEVVGGGFSNVPETFGPALVGRIGINRGGIAGYSEADLEGGPLRLAVGASAIAELDADDDDQSSVRGELDAMVKVQGISVSGAVFAGSAQDGTDFLDQSYAATGLRAQAGYVVAGTYQPAVRYAAVFPDAGGEIHELLAGFSIYQFAHNLKWQSDVGAQLRDTGMDTAADFLARTQLQLAF